MKQHRGRATSDVSGNEDVAFAIAPATRFRVVSPRRSRCNVWGIWKGKKHHDDEYHEKEQLLLSLTIPTFHFTFTLSFKDRPRSFAFRQSRDCCRDIGAFHSF